MSAVRSEAGAVGAGLPVATQCTSSKGHGRRAWRFLGWPAGGLAGARYRVGENLAVDFDLAFAAWDDGEIFGSEQVRSWRLGLTLVYLVD